MPVARFIPAYAGNTVCPALSASPVTVHPRLRGEHLHPVRGVGFQRGSSPPTRGTHEQSLCGAGTVRFIPAYAGNTSARASRLPVAPVHPRLRGEHALTLPAISAPSGSSPPTRGTRSPDQVNCSGLRFIPAYAGNTPKAAISRLARSVHPRLRGEHCFRCNVAKAPSGSSPPTRGTLFL